MRYEDIKKYLGPADSEGDRYPVHTAVIFTLGGFVVRFNERDGECNTVTIEDIDGAYEDVSLDESAVRVYTLITE